MKTNLLKSILFFAAILCATNAWAWCGNSFITVNDTWCTGSNSYVHTGGKFDGKDLGTLTTLKLGGELQVYPAETTAASLYYKIDSGSEKSISLPYTGKDGNNSKHSGSGTVDLSSLSGGQHTIEVWFKHGSDYDSNNSKNYKATFTIDPVVTFNANGGTSSDYKQKVTYNTSTALTENTFTRTGYTFAGWNTKTDGTGTSYTDKEKVTLKADITLYAKWTANTYNITYDNLKGATHTNPATYTIESATITFTAPTSKPAGYTFTNWSPASIATGSTGSKTVTANWTANTNTPYVVEHYKQNIDGTYPVSATETENLTGTTDAKVTPAVKSYEGFTAPATQTVTIKADGSLVVEYQYARNQHTVTWVVDDEETEVQYLFGATINKPTNPTKEGYDFEGWDSEVPATMPDEDKIFSATWTAKKYTVTFNQNWATTNGAMNVTATYGSPLPSIADNLPTKTGYKFDGYWDGENGTGTQYYNAEGISVLNWDKTSDNVTLFAKWVQEEYTIIFDHQGGGDGTTSVTATYGAILPQVTPPTKTGYTFLRYTENPSDGFWWYDENGECSVDWNKTSGWTLYAQWTPNLYTITLNPQGGTEGTPSVTVHYETQDYSVNPVELPEKDGYNFGGYYVDTEGSGFQVVDKNGYWLANAHGYTDANGNWKQANNVTLYAHWIEKQYEQYTITYELNGGTNADNPTTYTIVTPDITLKAAGKMGYTFLGWYDNAEFDGTPITSIPTGSTGNKDLYAKWEERKLKINAEWLPEPYYVDNMTRSDKTYAYSKSELSPGDHHFKFVEYDGTFAYDFEDLKRDGGLEIGQQCPTCEFNDVKFNLDRESDITITLELQDPFDDTPPVVTIHAVEYYTISINSTTLKLKVNDAMPTITAQTPENGYAFMGYYTQANGEGTQFIDANGAWINVDGYIEEGKWIKKEDITLHPYFQQAQIATLTLDRTQIDAGDKGYVTPSYTIAPTPAGTVVVTWQLQYSNGNSVNGHEPIIEGETVKFSVDGLAAGAYKVVATLHLGDSNGEVLHTQEVGFVIVGAYTVTVKYMFENDEIAARTTHAGHPINQNSITAPDIGGYNFVQWVLGDGISSTSTLTEKTIKYLATYDGYLTATYKKKDLIFLDISTLPNKANWTAPHVYLYKEGGYWSEEKGTGSKSGGNFITDGAMTKVQGTTDIWYYEYAGVENFGGVVAFTSEKQSGYENFAKCEVIYRKDFTSGTPVFVPAAGQKAVDRNKIDGQTAQYYSEGYWVRYMGRTGYSLLIYNEAGDTELMRQDFTSDNLRMSMKAIIDLEANHTYKYEVLRDNDYYYKNSGTLTTNNKGPVKLNSKDKGSIKTTESGNYVFTLDYVLDNNEGDLQLSVDYPVAIGDYHVLYKDDTRSTYKPSQIIKKDVAEPIVGYFVRPRKNPELKVQSAARISDGGVTWYNSDNEIFFKPNNNWKSDGARFAAWFNGDKWKDLNKNGDVYSCEIPSGATEVIFCRMDPKKATNNWNNKWNQTGHLTLTTENLYTLNEGEWGNKLYLKPNSNWFQKDGNKKDPRFAAYFFNSGSDYAWVSMGNPVDGVYSCDIPAKVYKNVIFCRMNGGNETNDWNNKYNQSSDLEVPTDGKTLYTVKDGTWDNGGGSWSVKEGSWSTINGSITDLSVQLKNKLAELDLEDIKETEGSVFNIHLSYNEGTLTIKKVAIYTGNYYIRVDAADGKWYDYKNNKDNLMTYSAFSESDANSFGEKFSHYKTAWCTKGTNVKFVIANDYSLCISDTLIQDEGNPFDNIDEHGNLKNDDKYSANIRFMWNRKDNKVSRAYVAGADEKKEFLVLKANQSIKDEQGNTITGNKAIFEDTQNWIYERTIQLKPGTRVRLYACYPDENEAEAQYFSGEYNTTWDDKNSTSLLTGSDGTEYAIRVIYDFKTNRLMTAWIPSHTIDNTLALNADMMIVREHQENAQSIVFAKSENQLTEIKTVYGTLRLNRWILNNRGGADNLKVESCTIEEDDGHRKYDEEVTNENHAPLPLAGQKSLYERALYFISFPFDVHLSDVFGFGTYGTHWVISKYNGLRRAQNGYFIDNCVNEDCTNWDYIWDPDEFVMKANEGYLLSLDLDLMKYNNIDFWKNNRATVELYFPSRENVKTIGQTDYTMDGLGEEYLCQKNYNTNGDKPDSDRTIKDSYWRCIGVPSFADYSGELTDGRKPIVWTADQNAFPFLYEWNTIDNSLVARSTSNFEFRSTFAYLVQNGNEIHWTAVNTKPNPIIARETVANVNYEWKITLQSKEEVVDHTYIRMTSNEEVTYEFDFNQDLVKELNYGRADIYTMIGYERVAANSLPLSENTTVVSLGLDIETAGDYTIAMPEGVMSVGVTLYDAETGTRTNLSAGMEYTIALNKGVCDNRLYLEISPIQNDAPTDIENIGEGVNNGKAVNKYLIDGKLIIRTAEGVVFDAQGHRL